MADSNVWFAVPFVAFVLAAPLAAQSTELYTVSTGGAQGNGGSGSNSASIISADGRFLVFGSGATNLVPGDTNGVSDLFVRDRVLGTTRRVNVSTSGVQADFHPNWSEISADGRYVVFASNASTLVPGDAGMVDEDVFLHDLHTSVTTCVSVDSSGVPVTGSNPSISADGRFVAFESWATNLVSGDTNSMLDIFVRDRQSGTVQRMSVGPGGVQANDHCEHPSISANGRYVAFLSEASNLVAGDTNPNEDVFVHDRQTGLTERVDVASDGTQGNNYLDFVNGASTPAISADGRFVAFFSNATNLVPGDTNGHQDVFVRDRVGGTTERASIGSAGQQGAGTFADFWMSADGRWVAFSDPSSLVPGDTNGKWDVFVRDRLLGTTERASVPAGGGEGDESSSGAAISADGRCVVFGSNATNMVPGDVNGQFDGFLLDRGTAGFTSLCEPGVGGVVSCPCSNPPDGPGRGCDNFGSSTGGAALVGWGNASLASDSVILSSAGENTSALTSFWTGGTQISPPGVAHGAGVRCVSGLHRLYSGVAAGGFISRPLMGDPRLSTRSAAVGAPIVAGQVRYYFAIYRDAQAAGPCGNSSSTVNLSNAVSAQWGP